MNNRFAILSLTFLLPVFLWAHGDRISISFSGIVSENTGKSVSGATISIEHNGQVIHSTRSDEKGNFSIKMEGPFSRPDKLKVKVYKKGYETRYLTPINCRNAEIEVQMHRSPTPIPIMRTEPAGGMLI